MFRSARFNILTRARLVWGNPGCKTKNAMQIDKRNFYHKFKISDPEKHIMFGITKSIFRTAIVLHPAASDDDCHLTPNSTTPNRRPLRAICHICYRRLTVLFVSLEYVWPGYIDYTTIFSHGDNQDDSPVAAKFHILYILSFLPLLL